MKRKQNKCGLTLVEILVAIAIIATLAAGLYSVSNYVETQSKKNLTQSTIETLCCALEQYYDFYDGVRGVGKFPDPNAQSSATPGPNDVPVNCSLNMEKLYYRLSLCPDAKKILSQITHSLIKDVDNDKYPEIVDAWGTDFRYSYVSGDNFPVITSAGHDKDFGDSDPGKKEDNISSR